MKAEIFAVGDQFTLALLNSTWEGLLLVLFIGGSLRLMGPTNAATRHAAWFALLTLLGALAPVHFWSERLNLRPTTLTQMPPSPAASAHVLAPQSAVDPKPVEAAQAPFAMTAVAEPLEAGSGIKPVSLDKAFRPAEMGWVRTWFDRSLRAIALQTPVPPGTGAIVTLAWATVALFKLCRVLWGMVRIRNVKRQALPASAEANQILARLAPKWA